MEKILIADDEQLMRRLVHDFLLPEGYVCMDIERRLGRQRHEKWGARTIDLDLVYSPDEECHTVNLQLPHPYLTQRAFVLVPLQEIAPNLCFYGKSIDRWIHRVSQEGQQVRRYRKGNTWKKF